MNVAIVCMTMCPDHLIDWVGYHLRLGFCRIYLRLEGGVMMDMETRLSRFPEVSILERELYPMGDQMERQCFLVDVAIDRAREESHDLLLHIDDDELFFTEDLQQLLKRMEKYRGWDYLHFTNAEALYPPSGRNVSCLRKTEWFHECSRTEPCRGYGNGKSMVRLDSPVAGSFGVHFFQGKGLDVPPDDARILHFESCDFDLWKWKFSVSNPSNFPFYKKSRDAIARCQDAADKEECNKMLFNAYTSLTGLESQPSRKHFPISHRFM